MIIYFFYNMIKLNEFIEYNRVWFRSQFFFLTFREYVTYV